MGDGAAQEEGQRQRAKIARPSHGRKLAHGAAGEANLQTLQPRPLRKSQLHTCAPSKAVAKSTQPASVAKHTPETVQPLRAWRRRWTLRVLQTFPLSLVSCASLLLASTPRNDPPKSPARQPQASPHATASTRPQMVFSKPTQPPEDSCYMNSDSGSELHALVAETQAGYREALARLGVRSHSPVSKAVAALGLDHCRPFDLDANPDFDILRDPA